MLLITDHCVMKHKPSHQQPLHYLPFHPSTDVMLRISCRYFLRVKYYSWFLQKINTGWMSLQITLNMTAMMTQYT